MTDTEIIQAIGKGFDGQANRFSAVDQAIAHLQESANKPVVQLDAAPKLEPDNVPVAKLEERGFVAGITGMEVWDIPVGQALVGGFVAVLGTELIDGFMARSSVMTRGIAKLIGAGVAIKWGPRLLGSTGSKAVGLLMAFDGLRDILPIDQWAKGVAGAASGVVTQRGLAGIADTRAVREAEEVAGYASAGGFYPSVNRRVG